MTHETFMQRAFALAQTTMRANKGGPFGAVVVREGEIVAEGTNEVLDSNDPTAHAEIVAIRRACERLATFDLSDCEIVTSCEPCPMCLGAIYWARVRHIYYGKTREEAAAIGFDDDFIYREVGLALADRSIPMTQTMTSDLPDIFAEWAVKPDKVPY